MNKKILIPTLALTVLAGAGLFSVNNVYADETTSNFPPIIQKLIEKFNLDEGEVSTLLEQHREEKQAEMQNRKRSPDIAGCLGVLKQYRIYEYRR